MKVLFLIHNLGSGGAEKVLVNLVNNMDTAKNDITVATLFGGGVNEQFLSDKIKHYSVFPKMIRGNSYLMKLLSPRQLHKLCVKEQYDVEIAYLEGPSSRVISGCPDKETKLISWIHVEQHNMKKVAGSFRSEKEALSCYNRFDQVVCVSKFVKEDFTKILNYKKPVTVLYNTIESEKIRTSSLEPVSEMDSPAEKKLIAVGTLKASKGYMRLLEIIRKLKEEHSIHLYILGVGPLEKEMKKYINENNLNENVTLLGYKTNPYKYVAKSDLLVCASYAEGFSTAVSEALIVGTPVCTVNVSGMTELLGENSEYGLITDNSEQSLCQGIQTLIENDELLNHYAVQAAERGKMFETSMTVEAVEKMLDKVHKGDYQC